MKLKLKNTPWNKNVKQLHFLFNHCHFIPLQLRVILAHNDIKHCKGVSRTPPIIFDNSLSMVYWLLRVILLGKCARKPSFGPCYRKFSTTGYFLMTSALPKTRICHRVESPPNYLWQVSAISILSCRRYGQEKNSACFTPKHPWDMVTSTEYKPINKVQCCWWSLIVDN